METGLALPARHQVLVVADQAGAEVTVWCWVGRGRQDVLRTVGGAVGGEVVILDETAVTVSTVEVVGQTALLNRKYSTLLCCAVKPLAKPTLMLQPTKAPYS